MACLSPCVTGLWVCCLCAVLLTSLPCGCAPVLVSRFCVARVQSNIAGVNVPLAVSPVLTSASYSSSVPYTCGAPGSTTSPYPSSWQFTVPSVYYNWVTSGGASCTSNSNCASGQICGLTNVPGRSPQTELQCGTSIGYWSANAVCAQDEDVGSPFDCNIAMQSPNVGATLDELGRCSGSLGPKSCYQPDAGVDCCGCVDWQDVLDTSAVPASTRQCVNDNANWNKYILPKLQWLKAGAPSAYVYPYDDMSSTFTCSQMDGGSYNRIDYQLALCPSGSSSFVESPIVSDEPHGYMSTTAPPSQPLPSCNSGNIAYYGTDTETVTAHNFPAVSPSCGTWNVTVVYDSPDQRYIHFDLCTGSWNCFAQTQAGPVAAGTGSVQVTLTGCNPPDNGSGYLYSVWTVSPTDNTASEPTLRRHAWQVYSPVTLGAYRTSSCSERVHREADREEWSEARRGRR